MLRFGGNCPHCMLEIPGEEAPTDPGLEAKKRQEEEEKVRHAAAARKSRLLGAFGLVALIGVGAGGFLAWQKSQEAITYEMDDFYVMPLDEIAQAPAGDDPAATPPAEGAAAAKASPAGRKSGGGNRKSSGGGTVAPDAVADAQSNVGEPVLKRASGTRAGDAVPAGVSTALPTSSSGLGGGAIRIEQVGGGGVLTDPAEINEMMRRVIGALSPQVTNCYTQRLKQVESLKGAWNVSFVVTREGGTRAVDARGVNGSDAELEACIERAVGSWRFEKINKDSQVKKTYRFGAQNW